MTRHTDTNSIITSLDSHNEWAFFFHLLSLVMRWSFLSLSISRISLGVATAIKWQISKTLVFSLFFYCVRKCVALNSIRDDDCDLHVQSCIFAIHLCGFTQRSPLFLLEYIPLCVQVMDEKRERVFPSENEMLIFMITFKSLWLPTHLQLNCHFDIVNVL